MLSKMKDCLAAEYIHTEQGGDFALRREGDTLKIFFEWSDGREDWKNNLKFFAVPKKPYKNMSRSWFCHRGFLKVWRAIEPYIAREIEDVTLRKIEITGYSHGAAIALLCYEYCRYHRQDASVTGTGFGCPRVVWGLLPKSVKERFDGFRAVRCGNDIVTHLPPCLLGYRHPAPLVKIGQTNPVEDHKSTSYLRFLG